MGMDVYGRMPTSKVGCYFRANLWTWAPIHALMATLCPDLLDERLLKQLAYNDRAGPEDQATCTEIAQRFDRWMERYFEVYEMEAGERVRPDGSVLTEDEIADNPYLAVSDRVHEEHLKWWIEFLRHCGGFEVW